MNRFLHLLNSLNKTLKIILENGRKILEKSGKTQGNLSVRKCGNHAQRLPMVSGLCRTVLSKNTGAWYYGLLLHAPTCCVYICDVTARYIGGWGWQGEQGNRLHVIALRNLKPQTHLGIPAMTPLMLECVFWEALHSTKNTRYVCNINIWYLRNCRISQKQWNDEINVDRTCYQGHCHCISKASCQIFSFHCLGSRKSKYTCKWDSRALSITRNGISWFAINHNMHTGR